MGTVLYGMTFTHSFGTFKSLLLYLNILNIIQDSCLYNFKNCFSKMDINELELDRQQNDVKTDMFLLLLLLLLFSSMVHFVKTVNSVRDLC